jgi:hypothetical protein
MTVSSLMTLSFWRFDDGFNPYDHRLLWTWFRGGRCGDPFQRCFSLRRLRVNMRRDFFQTRKIGVFPIDAVVENVGGQAAGDIVIQRGRVFILQVLDYDPKSRRLNIRIEPGNGMVSVVATEEASGTKYCE